MILSPYQKPPIGAKLNYSHPLTKGLAGCWLFNEGSGNKVNDCSGNSNHGTISGVAAQSATSGWDAGVNGAALLLDGVNDYINIPGCDDWNLGSKDFTIITAIQSTQATQYATLISKSPYSFAASGEWSLLLNKVSAGAGDISFYCWDYSDFNPMLTTAGSLWNSGRPTFITLTRRGSEWAIYVNNVAAAATTSSITIGDIASPISIGRDASYARYLNGRINLSLFYCRGLSEAEIAYLNAFPYCMFDVASDRVLYFMSWPTQYTETIEESLALTDELRYFTETIEETLIIFDRFSYFFEDIEDSLILADRFPYFEETIAETIDFMGLPYPSWDKSVEDGFDVSDTSEDMLHIDKDIGENIAIADVSAVGWEKVISDTVFIYDTTLPGWVKSISEGINLADSPLPILGIPVSDWLKLTDSQDNTWKGTEIIPEKLNLYDVPKYGFLLGIAESLGLADTLRTYLCLLVPDVLTIVDSQNNTWKGTVTVPVENLGLYDLPYGARGINRSISETLDLADTLTIKWVISVLEYMRFSDLLTVIGTFNHNVAETLGLSDEASRAYDKLISETLSLVDIASVLSTFMPSIAESLNLADSSANKLTVNKFITDTIGMADAAGNNLVAYCAVQDGISLNVSIELDGEIYRCFVLNTPKFHASIYSGFDFNSYCVFEGKTFGANSTGVYELTGTTDAGNEIHAGVIMSATDFGSPNQKRFRRGYLGISGTMPMMVFETEEGKREAYEIDSGKVAVSSELKSKKWKLAVTNFNELDLIKLLPVILTK